MENKLTFDFQSIQSHCHSDIKKFEKLNKYTNTIHFKLQEKMNSLQLIQKVMDNIKTLFGNITQKYKITFEDYDFHRHHHLVKDEDRNKLWIIRNFLFYQVLIIASELVQNKVLFKTFYKKFKKNRKYNNDFVSEISRFKIGLFGSIKKTSDIDVNIQYVGTKENFHELAYIVSILEDLFVFLLDKESLAFDIECYADMQTIFDGKQDIYYLDTSSFELNDFEKILPFVAAGIIRNYNIAKKEMHNKPIKEYEMRHSEMYKNIVDDLPIKNNKDLLNIFRDRKWMVQANEMIREYNENSYDYRREKYYNLVRETEKNVAIIRTHVLKKLPLREMKNYIQQVIYNSAFALLFREESYVCAPTITHIVRLMQQNENENKYPCSYPKIHPNCAIGEIGYLLSMMEQLGYMYRYKLLKNAEKVEKYHKRFVDARQKYNLFQTPSRNTSVKKISSVVKRNKKSLTKKSKKKS